MTNKTLSQYRLLSDNKFAASAGADGLPKVPQGAARILGAGFGTKSSDVYYDDFESRTAGNVTADVGELKWPGGSTGSSIVTARKHSGSKALQHDFSLNDFPKLYRPLNNANKLYLSCWIYRDGTVSGSTVHKYSRVGANNVYHGSPHAGASYGSAGGADSPQSYGGEIVTGAGAGSITSSSSDITGATTTPALLMQINAWQFYEAEFYAGTVDGSNCFFEERVDGLSATRWVNRPFLTAGNSKLLDWVLLPVNGLDNAPPIKYTLDEVYITSDRARVVMSDTANNVTPTKIAAQKDLTWSDTAIYFTRKRGMFSVGDTAYYHVYNTSGVKVYSSPAFTVTEDGI